MLALFRDIARFGYNHATVLAGLLLPYAIVLIAAKLMALSWGSRQPLWHGFYFSLLLAVYPFYLGRVIKYLASCAGPAAEVPKEFSINAREWRSLLVVYLLVTLLVGCGLLFLLLPGVYLAARFAFAQFIALLRVEPPVVSLEKSWRETEPHAWSLFFGTLIIFGFAMLLGMPFAPDPDDSIVARLADGLVSEVIWLLNMLILNVFFFRVYCLSKHRK